MAFEFTEKALLIDPKNQRARYIRAFVLNKMSKGPEALSDLHSLIHENASNFRAFGLLADIKIASGNKKEAIEFMTRELELNTNHPERQTLLGTLLLEQSKPADAITHLRAALLRSPRHRQALLVMGQAQARNGNIDKALYYFDRLRRYYPDAREALEAVVETCERIQDLRRAELVLRDDRKARPSQNDAGVLLARVYFMQEKLEEAVTLAGQLSEGGKSAEAAMIQAMALSKSGKEAEALAALESIKSTDDEAYLNRLKAELSIKLERFDNAEKCALRSFATKPWASGALILQGEALLQLKSPAKAWFALARSRVIAGPNDHVTGMMQSANAKIKSRRKNVKPATGSGTRVAS
jgi:predicted Zn-dependent protease